MAKVSMVKYLVFAYSIKPYLLLLTLRQIIPIPVANTVRQWKVR